MNLSFPVLYSQGLVSAFNNRQLENDLKKEKEQMSFIMSMLPPQHTGGPFMEPLESWVNRMHVGKREPVSTRDERLCKEDFMKCAESSYESSISLKSGHFFFPLGKCWVFHFFFIS